MRKELPLRPDDQCCYRTADKRDDRDVSIERINITRPPTRGWQRPRAYGLVEIGVGKSVATAQLGGDRFAQDTARAGSARLEPPCSFLPSESGERGLMGGPDSEGGQPGIHSGPNGKSKLIGIWFYLPRRCRAP